MLRITSIFFLAITLPLCSFGQKGTHTPYSTIGLGELRSNDYASFRAMGGIGLAATDSAIVNHLNPATYCNFTRYRPIFQIGMNGKFSRFETSTASTVQRNSRLDQFQMGIPIKKKWGAAFGLKPYSFTGYQISNYIVENGDSTELYTREGDGGITQVYIGVSYRPLETSKTDTIYKNIKDSAGVKQKASYYRVITNNLSLGANVNYLFGSNNQIRTFQYSTPSSGLNAKVINSTRLKDFIYDFGLSYQLGFKKSSFDGKESSMHTLSVGATYSPAIQAKAFNDLFSYSYITLGGGFNGPEALSDTIEYNFNNEGSITIPESYKAGIEWRLGPSSLANPSLLRIGADVRYQKWSNYDESFEADFQNELKDRTRFAVGLEWTPNALGDSKSTPFLSQIRYRMGFNYTMTEKRLLNNLNNYTDLTDYGMSFGLGIPVSIVRNSNTSINFGAKFGRMGTVENGLIQEEYVGLFFGVSITPGYGNYWFKKRKYD